MYNFKNVTVVPNGKEFVDIVLSKTQRKTPTVVHKGYHISRIRQFYMKKIKFTQKSVNEKLSAILTEFPRVDDIHPFYGDLIHVLYDRDHLKVALGQVSSVRHIVDNIGRDYVRLLKYGDSLYRCKQLKRAALGRTATALKKLHAALSYLEKVRQHLSRLPSIDPNARTLLITGFPNVGKSSFMNKVTRADVEVQDFAFTTKALYVGHTDYNYTTWQVIDTPGILDHSLEQRNVIEMQAITALAHLRACILYFMDLSENCGYNIHQQISLFKSIQPLFTGKPLVVVFNKCDLWKLSDLDAETHDLVMGVVEEAGAKYITTSTLTDIGVGDLKTLACDLLLEHRAEQKEGTARFQSMQNRLYTATPTTRDGLSRASAIPATVLTEMALPEDQRPKRVTEKDLEQAGGGPGQYQYDERKPWDLEKPEWVTDIQPEFMDGMNIADYVDPDIQDRLIELEADEERRLSRLELDETKKSAIPKYHISEATNEAASFIRDRIRIIKMERAMKNTGAPQTPRQRMANERFLTSTGGHRDLDEEFGDSDEDGDGGSSKVRTTNPDGTPRSRSKVALERLQSKTRAAVARSSSRGRSATGREPTHMEDAFQRDRSRSGSVSTKSSRGLSGRSASKGDGARSLSVARGEGFRDARQKLKALKTGSKGRAEMGRAARFGRQGEGDRVHGNEMPRHLFSGKMNTIGKRDRR